MQNNAPESSGLFLKPRYEAREPHLRNPLIVVSSALFLLLLSLGCGGILIHWFSQERPLNQMGPLGIIAAPDLKPLQRFPAPDLEIDDGHDDSTSLRQQQSEQLNSYGWIDKSHGVVRIPIERAMDLLLLKGLPVRTNSLSGIGNSELQLQQERPEQQ